MCFPVFLSAAHNRGVFLLKKKKVLCVCATGHLWLFFLHKPCPHVHFHNCTNVAKKGPDQLRMWLCNWICRCINDALLMQAWRCFASLQEDFLNSSAPSDWTFEHKHCKNLPVLPVLTASAEWHNTGLIKRFQCYLQENCKGVVIFIKRTKLLGTYKAVLYCKYIRALFTLKSYSKAI